MGKAQTIHTKILSEEGILYEGDCRVVFVPTQMDELAVLPYHTPLITIMGEGDVRVKEESGTRSIIKVKSGILYVGENQATVLVNA